MAVAAGLQRASLTCCLPRGLYFFSAPHDEERDGVNVNLWKATKEIDLDLYTGTTSAPTVGLRTFLGITPWVNVSHSR